MTIRQKKVVLATGISILVLLPVAASALSVEGVGGTLGLGSADLKNTTVNAVQWVLGLLGLVAIAMIIIGSIVAATSAGSDRADAAKRTIIAALVGLVIVLLSWAIVTFVIGTTANVTQ